MIMHKRTTLQMVADAVGVAAGTVSAVLSGHKGSMRYSFETAERVRAMAKKMHYEPNLQARGVLQGKSYLLAVIFNSQFWRIVERIIPAIRTVCYDRDYELLLYPSDNPEMELKNLQMARRRSVDGILLLPVSSLNKKNLQEFLDFASSGRPVIQFLYRMTPQLPFIGRNFNNLCKQGIEHLLSKGHSLPGLIVSSNYDDAEEGGASYNLAQAYLKEMHLHNLKPCILSLPLSAPNISTFQNAIRCVSLLQVDLLLQHGWLVASSSMAYGIIHGINRTALQTHLPYFVSCSDDLELPSELLPPLPYFPVPYDEVGRLTAQWGLEGVSTGKKTHTISSKLSINRKGNAV